MVLALLALAGVLSWVDLSPRVESDFFFSSDDPQLIASEEIARAFPSSPQIIVRAGAGDTQSDAYLSEVEALTEALEGVPGVSSVNSVTTERADRSPLWSRVLLPSGGEATNLIVSTQTTDAGALVQALEEVLEARSGEAVALQMSGVPVIVELIRRSLYRDLRVFSLAALLIFGALIAIVYQSATVVLGTLITAGLACSLTLLLNHRLGLSIGLLTANIVTIVFVLTLSHIVFLTANSRRLGAARAVAATLPASFWAMVTTLLGFLSLTIASARPLRELGLAGATGTILAIITAYLVYPAFLDDPEVDRAEPKPSSFEPGSHRRAVLAFAVAVGVCGLGVLRVNTDPDLLSYFAADSDIRSGLDAIDREGGSSTLDVVVRDASGGRLDEESVNEKMWVAQEALEVLPDVGVVVSPPVLLGHARIQPLAGFLSLGMLADILQSDALDNVGLAFLSEDRLEGRFYARMHESGREQTRTEVITDVEEAVRSAGLEPVLIGGVYDLQAQLGQLIAASLRVGLGGLLVLFLLIGYIVSRSWRVTSVMFLCLAGIPLVVLGAFGHLGIPIDMITSPAANVALALGVDAMIHLVVRARATGDWLTARAEMRQPILAGALIICVGFGIFAVSSFPPTARFGAAVILGTLTAATMALWVLPTWVGSRPQAGGDAGATASLT